MKKMVLLYRYDLYQIFLKIMLKENDELKVIESLKNPKVKDWKKLLSKKGRDKSGLYIVEGFHLVEEALKEPNIVSEIILTNQVEIPEKWNLEHVSLTKVTSEIMKVICETETPQGIAAICKQQTGTISNKHRKLLLVDAVQDPGNLGTMIRTADAAGIDAVVLGIGTVDLYNAKTIRATQGSLFHVPIIKDDLTAIIPKLKENGIPIYGTSLKDGVVYKNEAPSEAFALLVGNEGNGVSQELLTLTDQNLYIPIYGKAESLNVAIASAILIYHFVK